MPELDNPLGGTCRWNRINLPVNNRSGIFIASESADNWSCL